ncbi:hypothetical protein CPB86DRAFT_729255 [Serendipita vermifera]|nr:hypothetical protein CPB86DRAFT_729255 [Serendipita vermifera]
MENARLARSQLGALDDYDENTWQKKSNEVAELTLRNIYSSAPNVYLPPNMLLEEEPVGSVPMETEEEAPVTNNSPGNDFERAGSAESALTPDGESGVTTGDEDEIMKNAAPSEVNNKSQDSPEQSSKRQEPTRRAPFRSVRTIKFDSEEEDELDPSDEELANRKRKLSASGQGGKESKRARLAGGRVIPPKEPEPEPLTYAERKEKKRDEITNEPGYPYWGAEHSPHPPPFVSFPIPKPEIGLHMLVDPYEEKLAFQEARRAKASGEVGPVLDDGEDDKPGYSYVVLIRHAILGSPKKKLTVEGIYQQLMGRFHYFRVRDGKTEKGWKCTVRHQLSLFACFEKKEREIWEGGKGVWWTVNEQVPEGEQKREKRKKRPPKANPEGPQKGKVKEAPFNPDTQLKAGPSLKVKPVAQALVAPVLAAQVREPPVALHSTSPSSSRHTPERAAVIPSQPVTNNDAAADSGSTALVPSSTDPVSKEILASSPPATTPPAIQPAVIPAATQVTSRTVSPHNSPPRNSPLHDTDSLDTTAPAPLVNSEPITTPSQSTASTHNTTSTNNAAPLVPGMGVAHRSLQVLAQPPMQSQQKLAKTPSATNNSTKIILKNKQRSTKPSLHTHLQRSMSFKPYSHSASQFTSSDAKAASKSSSTRRKGVNSMEIEKNQEEGNEDSFESEEDDEY